MHYYDTNLRLMQTCCTMAIVHTCLSQVVSRHRDCSRRGRVETLPNSAFRQRPAALRMDPYHRTPSTLEGQIQYLNSTVARLVSDVARLNESHKHPLTEGTNTSNR